MQNTGAGRQIATATAAAATVRVQVMRGERQRLVGGKGERMPSENEMAAARFQGRHVAQIAKKLSVWRNHR